MTEYIEREAAKEAIGFVKLHFTACGEDKSLLDVINEVPAADVAPVVHGRWIDTGFFNSYKSPIYECSACHKEVYDHYIDCHKYCLHCGARMDGE